ncbi:Por secretion system C-terminal sorting domain-containing protein [Flexibacter flexilis DSM 6793]|uniref:Por secretion system C-terminal sorting domain-containing protein n=1 Tax=Flexibacter flexilis DSM 6793 TaxID=927664 RepID=A0A1I1DDS5_9BACT|nr:T9SS type A sorting domain-containing protein [Flexibacter flexilis]SFB72997.1 Por secretion system C-terminal sorting domain-containing protein [Flexibacter flexilis DSM 6793]
MRKFLSLSVASMAIAFSSYGQLSGVKTINPAGTGADNYTSFTSAVAALKVAGVGPGGVTFNVTPGVYPERFTIDSLATVGASASSQVIFQKDPAAAAEAGVFVRPATAGATVINVYMASWVTLDGLNLEDGDGGNAANRTNRGMQLSGAEHCTFKNFTIRMNSRGQLLNTASRGIASATSFGAATRPLRYNTFDNLRIVSVGNRAFSLFSDYPGSATDANLHDRGNIVVNCKIDSAGGGNTGGTTNIAFFLEQDSLHFVNNQITNVIHQPSTASDMTILQVGSNRDNVPTRGMIIENNIIDAGVENYVAGASEMVRSQITSGTIFRNNTITNFVTDDAVGFVNSTCTDCEVYNNTFSNVEAGGGDCIGIQPIKDMGASKLYGNTITNLTTTFEDGTALGIDAQLPFTLDVYGNKISNIFVSDGVVANAIGIRSSSVIIADTASNTGGVVNIYNNFISGVYLYSADMTDGGLPLAFGIRSMGWTSSGVLVSGGTQNINHNTIVMNRPTDLVGDIAHKFAGVYLYGSEDDEADVVSLRNNIVVNRNTYAEGDTSLSYLVRYAGDATIANVESNNYFGFDTTNVALGVYYDAVADEHTIYPTLAAWKAAGLDGAGYSDSTEVSFVDEAAGDLHVSTADYTNPALRAPRLSLVSTDVDGTARASADTQKGADSQDGEQNLNPWSVKGNAAKAKSLTVFPNPATEVARFQMTVEKETAAQIVVRNLMGQVVATKNVTLYAGSNTTGINVSGLASGMYVYNVNVNGQSYAGKFVK